MRWIPLAAALFLMGPSLRAQVIPVSRPRPNLLVGGVGIAVSPASLTFALAQGAVSNPGTVTITTTLGGLGVADTLVLTAYFASPSALTTSAGDTIFSSQVQGSCATCLSTSYIPFTQNSAYGTGSSLALLNQVTLLTVAGGARTDTLNLRVDLSATPNLSAGVYTGTLVLAAQVF